MTDVVSPFGTYKLNDRQAQLLRWAQGMPVGWLGRRGALLLRKSLLMGNLSVIDAVVDGLMMRLYMKDNVSERKFLFMPQFFDRLERDLLKKHLKPGAIFVDIGANAGIYSLSAAPLVGHEGRVLSIEPNPALVDRLVFNMTLNGFDHQMLVEQAGISDREGYFDLVLDEKNLGGASIVAVRSNEKITVRCHTLFDIVMKYHLPRITALKIDIEGAEDRALAPFFEKAPETLYPGLLIVENSPQDWKQDLKAVVAKAGYRLLQTTRMNLIWVRE